MTFGTVGEGKSKGDCITLLYLDNLFIHSLVHGVLCRTNFNISEDAHVILTESEHGLYAYVRVISMLLLSEVILLPVPLK